MHHLKIFPNLQKFEVIASKAKKEKRVNLLQRSIIVQRLFLNNAKYLIQIRINYLQFNIFP